MNSDTKFEPDRLAIQVAQKDTQIILHFDTTRCPKKHGNSVTNSISSLLLNSIVIPNFNSHNIIMAVRVYFMKSVKDCNGVSLMSPQDEQ